jgi:hypothetical protein
VNTGTPAVVTGDAGASEDEGGFRTNGLENGLSAGLEPDVVLGSAPRPSMGFSRPFPATGATAAITSANTKDNHMCEQPSVHPVTAGAGAGAGTVEWRASGEDAIGLLG